MLVLGLACVGALSGTHARANDHFGSWLGLTPTEYVVVPSSYTVSDGFVPTVYVPTYVATTYYVRRPATYVIPTVYVEPLVYAPRSYVVTTGYYYPTAYVDPSVYTATFVDPCATSEPAPRARSGGTGEASPTSATKRVPGTGAGRSTPRTLESAPASGRTTSSSIPEPPTGAESGQRREPDPFPLPDMNVPSPPAAPAPEPPNTLITPGAGAESAAGGAAQPAAPADRPAPGKPPIAPSTDASKDDTPVVGAQAEDPLRRVVQKPVTPTVATRPFLRSASKKNLNVLEGRVVSSESGQSEEEVRIRFTSKNRSAPDRQVTTDAYGRYAVRLPDGEWTVNVAMPNGRSFPVSQLLVSGGQITDDAGRSVPSLTITR
jgi:hypothetical protein